MYKNHDIIIFLIILGFVYIYVSNKSKNNKEKKVNCNNKEYIDKNYDRYDEFNYMSFNKKNLEDINPIYIPYFTEKNIDDRDSRQKYLDTKCYPIDYCSEKYNNDMDIQKCLFKKSLENPKLYNDCYNQADQHLKDEYDDPVDRINEFVHKQNHELDGIKIKDMYDSLTRGIEYPTKKLKQPLIDPVTGDPVYINESRNMQKTVRSDMWMYDKENVLNGGHMGNGLFGHDSMDNYHAISY